MLPHLQVCFQCQDGRSVWVCCGIPCELSHKYLIKRADMRVLRRPSTGPCGRLVCCEARLVQKGYWAKGGEQVVPVVCTQVEVDCAEVASGFEEQRNGGRRSSGGLLSHESGPTVEGLHVDEQLACHCLLLEPRRHALRDPR